MNVLNVILVVVALLGLAVFGMSIKILFGKKGDKKFPELHIGKNKNMKSQGITCAQTYDKIEQKKGREIKIKQLNLSK